MAKVNDFPDNQLAKFRVVSDFYSPEISMKHRTSSPTGWTPCNHNNQVHFTVSHLLLINIDSLQ